MPKSILIHPANSGVFDRIPRAKSDPLTELAGMRIVYSRAAPLRATEDQWHPPQSDRFCEYGPEDEAWMRPLGLGRIETVDTGPWMAVVENGVPSVLKHPLSEPAFRFRFYGSPMPSPFGMIKDYC